MRESDGELGAVVYLRAATNDKAMLLRRLFAGVSGGVRGLEMKYFQTMMTGRDALSRQRKLTPEREADMLDSVVKGSVDSVSLQAHRIPRGCEDAPFLDVELDIPQDKEECAPWHLAVYCSRSTCRLEVVIPFLRRLVTDFGSDYGLILTGIHEYVWDVTNFTPMVWPMWYVDKPNPTLAVAREMGFYLSREHEFRETVPRASWGNVLSSVHISGLGGEEQIRRESGCYLVERWGENLYLQLTESPWDVPREKLLALNKYFEPIRFQEPPSPFTYDLRA